MVTSFRRHIEVPPFDFKDLGLIGNGMGEARNTQAKNSHKGGLVDNG